MTSVVTNLPCIVDCFENKPDNCVTSLLNDVISKGVCNLTLPSGEDFGPGIYTVSETCQFELDTFLVTKGTCSNETERLLVKDECLEIIFQQQLFLADTILRLIVTSCRADVSDFYLNFVSDNTLRRTYPAYCQNPNSTIRLHSYPMIHHPRPTPPTTNSTCILKSGRS